MLVALCCCALSAGCAGQCPTIDPTGQRIFAWPTSRYQPDPGPIHFSNTSSLTLTPAKLAAPVNSEVVLLAAVCGQSGYLMANERVNWSMSGGSVGQFVALGERYPLDWLHGVTGRPEILDATSAIGATSSKYLTLWRGTTDYTDDVYVQKGQAWITVSSPVEGTSYVTAMAPSVYEWAHRMQTATIYWVDAQWTFPPPAINPVGTRHTFTTTVTRQSNPASPHVGWIVRYEITGGPPAGFAPDGVQAIEVPTDALGRASAELFQTQPSPGTNTVSIQVIRPPQVIGGDGERVEIGRGMTQKTWSAPGSVTAPSASLRVVGPATAPVGGVATYRLEISNPGPTPIRQATVSSQLPAGLEFQNANPAPTSPMGTLQWPLGDLAAGHSSVIELNVRAAQGGTYNVCATLASADGMSAQECASTTVLGAGTSPYELTLQGPQRAVVGDVVTFKGMLTNRGATTLTGLTLVDRFDAGLAHAELRSPVERGIPDLAPGATWPIDISLRVAQPGNLCNNIEIHSGGKIQASQNACVVAVAAAGGAAPANQPSTLDVRKTVVGAERGVVGDTVKFRIEITNRGQTALNDLSITDSYDQALDPTMATAGHEFVGDNIVWKRPTLAAGASVSYEIECKCLNPAVNACNRVRVQSREGAMADGEACLPIAVARAGLNISVSDLTDPVQAGTDMEYVIRVVNNGQAPERQVAITAAAPAEMTPLAGKATGPARATIDGQTIRFDPIDIPARESRSYRIGVRAARAGDVTFRATVTSATTPSLVGEAKTTILAD